MIAITTHYFQNGFYKEPMFGDDINNMTWFDNVGETSSEKNILLNLTQYIANFTEEDLISESTYPFTTN